VPVPAVCQVGAVSRNIRAIHIHSLDREYPVRGFSSQHNPRRSFDPPRTPHLGERYELPELPHAERLIGEFLQYLRDDYQDVAAG